MSVNEFCNYWDSRPSNFKERIIFCLSFITMILIYSFLYFVVVLYYLTGFFLIDGIIWLIFGRNLYTYFN